MTADLAIVGAGPAGLAAAVLAAELRLDTVLIDEQEMPGGQVWRGLERPPQNPPRDRDERAGRALVTALRAGRARYLPSTTVWHIDPGGTLYLSRDGGAETLAARTVLLATGAIERPVPIPGWTLPGVMTAGAAQILLKSAGLVPEGRVVLAGQGPLLYLLAGQLEEAGAPPALLLETTRLANWRQALQEAASLWPGRYMLARGLGLIGRVLRAGIPVVRGVSGLRASGGRALERVLWQGGDTAADHLLLHEGVIPNVQASLALQLRHDWDDGQLCWRPAVDDWGAPASPTSALPATAPASPGRWRR